MKKSICWLETLEAREQTIKEASNLALGDLARLITTTTARIDSDDDNDLVILFIFVQLRLAPRTT